MNTTTRHSHTLKALCVAGVLGALPSSGRADVNVPSFAFIFYTTPEDCVILSEHHTSFAAASYGVVVLCEYPSEVPFADIVCVASDIDSDLDQQSGVSPMTTAIADVDIVDFMWGQNQSSDCPFIAPVGGSFGGEEGVFSSMEVQTAGAGSPFGTGFIRLLGLCEVEPRSPVINDDLRCFTRVAGDAGFLGGAQVEINLDCSMGGTPEIEVCIDELTIPIVPVATPSGMSPAMTSEALPVRSGLLIGDPANPTRLYGVLSTSTGAIPFGVGSALTMNAEGTAYQILNEKFDISGGSTIVIETVQFSLREDQLDVDGDGRFTSLDPAALSANPTMEFDFNQDGVIDAKDVGFLQSLADAEVAGPSQCESGVFGDLNDDGVVDCFDEQIGLPAVTGDITTPADWYMSLDQNLDGDVTAAERSAVLALWATLPMPCQADFDNDGDVDLGDFGAFGAAFGSDLNDGDPTNDANYNPAADFDNDGDVDLGDFGVFGMENGRTDCPTCP